VKSPRETNPEHISSNAFKITSVDSSIKELVLWSVNADYPPTLVSYFSGKVLQTREWIDAKKSVKDNFF